MTRTLPLIDELEAALNSGTDSRRIEMLTRITDLFVAASDDQISVFDDAMVRLVSKPRRAPGWRIGWRRSRTRRPM